MKQFLVFLLLTLLLVIVLVTIIQLSNIVKKVGEPVPASAVNPGCRSRTLPSFNVLQDSLLRSGSGFYEHPPIVHYAKFFKSLDNAEMVLNFREYISVLSVYKFLKPERFVFHTYTKFSGKYWDKIKGWKNVHVDVNVIPLVYEIGGKRAKYVEHHADYIKLSMLYKYGGTALDFDVIMLNGSRWRKLQRKSECILVEETGKINGGLYSCIKNSSFIGKWLEGYHKDYRPKSWLFNASHKPVHILTQGNVCYNVHVDETVCHDPTYGDHMRWLKPHGAKWKDKTAVHYYVKNGIPNDGEGLLKANFSLAEVVQYVYNA